MDDLSELAAHLWSLAERPPTPANQAEILAALKHKREGIQSVAAQVLGTSGRRDSIAPLRQWLLDCMQRESGWAARGVAVRELAKLVESRDTEWILDLYFGVPDWLTKHELFPLVRSLSPQATRTQLTAALHDPNWINRHAAVKAIGNMAFPDRQRLLSPMLSDPHSTVQRSARFLAQEA